LLVEKTSDAKRSGTAFGCWLSAAERLELGTGNWKLGTGNWKLETGNWKLATGN
jgi:hypothetical protein